MASGPATRAANATGALHLAASPGCGRALCADAFESALGKAGHRDPEIAAFYGDLRKRFSAIPGVRSASLSEDSPSEAGTGLPLGVSGAPPNDANRILPIGLAFFTTMQIPILTGRDIEERDRPGSPAAAIVGISRNARYGGLTSDIPPVA